MRPVALPALRESGADRFTWVSPGERLGGSTLLGGEHGAFIYESLASPFRPPAAIYFGVAPTPTLAPAPPPQHVEEDDAPPLAPARQSTAAQAEELGLGIVEVSLPLLLR